MSLPQPKLQQPKIILPLAMLWQCVHARFDVQTRVGKIYEKGMLCFFLQNRVLNKGKHTIALIYKHILYIQTFQLGGVL